MKSQQGIGLIEVMVALLLLAVAVLGFSSMQMFAIKSTDESVMRTRAMTVIRGGAEMMRSNADAIPKFKDTLNTANLDPNAKSRCKVTTPEQTTICSIEEQAEKDALILKQYAHDNEINIALADCPGMTGSQVRQCFIASWGDTLAEMSGSDKACAKANGIYRAGSQCFILEAY